MGVYHTGNHCFLKENIVPWGCFLESNVRTMFFGEMTQKLSYECWYLYPVYPAQLISLSRGSNTEYHIMEGQVMSKKSTRTGMESPLYSRNATQNTLKLEVNGLQLENWTAEDWKKSRWLQLLNIIWIIYLHDRQTCSVQDTVQVSPCKRFSHGCHYIHIWTKQNTA